MVAGALQPIPGAFADRGGARETGRARDGRLVALREKVLAGERLGAEEGRVLLETPDVIGLGRLAAARTPGRDVYFVVNRHVNATNVCALRCGFCDFRRGPRDADAYELSPDEVVAAIDPGVHEVHIVGGHHPRWCFERLLEIVRAVRARYPEIPVKAFTAAEIDFFARRSRIPVPAALEALREAGVACLPGGGAEVFSERVRRLLFRGKAPAERWLEIHRTAHRLGMPSNATMLYGHVETREERLQHLLALRALQDETGGFQAFVPLPYQPGSTRLARRASALEDLRMVAVARLLLDNVPHVKAYWVMMGEAAASVALHFGADDLDGTIGTERIAHAAGAPSAAGLAREQMVRMIRGAERVPVERDALYRTVRRYD